VLDGKVILNIGYSEAIMEYFNNSNFTGDNERNKEKS
jgi:hypothetical protein